MINLIREEEYPLVMRDIVEPVLSEIREDVYIDVKGGKYHAEVYEDENAERAIVIVHGYTESAEKFREMTWYLLDAGFSVFAIDHRGHAQSLRQVADTSITHVDKFDDYVDDLDAFIEQVVLPRTKGLPLCILGHSMGGAVTALELMRHPERFARAVLNAPMIAAVSEPFPRKGAQLLGAVMCLLGKAKERAFVGKPFDPAREKFETSLITSRARFEYYQRKRCARKELQNCSPTYSWVREAAGVTEPLVHRAGLIRVPVLLCQAMQETIVKTAEQNAFISKVPDGKLARFDTKHEIYSAHDELLGDYVNKVIDFLNED